MVLVVTSFWDLETETTLKELARYDLLAEIVYIGGGYLDFLCLEDG